MNIIHNRYSPLDQRYWKGIRLVLMTMGLWPAHALGEPKSIVYTNYHRCICFIDLLLVFAQTHYIWTHFNSTSFLEIGHMFMGLFGNMLAWIRLLISFDRNYGKCSAEFFNCIHLSSNNYNTQFSNKIVTKIENISKYFAQCLFVIVSAGTALFVALPIYVNYQNGAFTLDNIRSPNITLLSSVYISFPLIEHDRDVAGWCVVYVVSVGATVCIATCVSALDLYLFIMSFHVLGQISILQNDLEALPNPRTTSTERILNRGKFMIVEKEMFDAYENEWMREHLVTFAQRHQILIKFLHLLFDCFGNTLLATYLFHMVCGCFILLELAQGQIENYIRYGPLGAVLFGQLVMTSVILEQISTECEKLAESVYLTPWQYMSISNQQIIHILLTNLQKPMKLNVKGILEVGVRPMAGIIKSTFSYFTFLRTKKE